MKNCTVPQENICKVLLLPALIPVIHPVVEIFFFSLLLQGVSGLYSISLCSVAGVFSSLSPWGSVLGF